jgi:SAM-dependent methyltransferase
VSRIGKRLRSVLKRFVLVEQKDLNRKYAENQLNRRYLGGQLRGFTADFFVARERVLRPVMAEIEERGKFVPKMLQRDIFARYDERVIEYPVALDALLEMRRRGRGRLLDVGCLLNNRIISDQVRKHARSVWLWNANLEKLVYPEGLVYVISDMRKPILPEEASFDLVTCLSTLEHVGMDNTRYGGKPAEFTGEITNPERFAVEGLQNIMRYVAPNGRLLVSVPFGAFEFLYLYGEPNKAIYYTFDRTRVETLMRALDGFEIKVSVYRVIPQNGWFPAGLEEDQEMLRHADGCASAGGVVFIDAMRR